MAGKEGIFAIIDVNRSMGKLHKENMSRLDFAKESIRHLIRQKLLFNTKDNVGIMLKGVESEESGEFDGIKIYKKLDFPTVKLFEELDRIDVTNEDGSGDFFDSLEAALNEFIREYGKKKWNKRIFIITDGECPINKNADDIKRVARLLSTNEVKLNIIAVDFFSELEGDKEEDEEEKKTSLESRNQQQTVSSLKKLIEFSENVRIFTAKMADTIYKQFKKKKVNPVAKFRGPMILTPSVYIDVAVYAKTSKVDIPSLKKHSLATEMNLEDLKAGAITQERVYYVNDDPDQNPLSPEFITKSYNYGSSLVPISKTDEVLFKNQEHKCLKAIGFTDSFRVPRHHFMGGVDMVVPNPESTEDCKAFAAMVHEMLEMNKVLICRYVYRDNNDPKLVVLSPHVGKYGPALYLNTLPTVEDLRDYQFESLKPCNIKQEEVMAKFIDSLDLEKMDEEGEVHEALKPTDTYNPVLQYFYNCLEHKALKMDVDGENNLPALDDMIEDYLKPDKELFEGNKYVSFLPKVLELKENPQKEDKKKRVFWREMINTEMQENTGANERRLEEKLEAHKEEAKKNISTTRPIEDFREMLNYKYQDLTIPAMEQMKDIIMKFIVESFKGSYYIRSMECLKELRDACIEEDEVDLFNGFLNKLRMEFPKEKFADFWRLIVENRISLISVKENVKSMVSEDQSKEWLDALSKIQVITSTIECEMDELMADID